ncbi:MAG: hypothetical protein ABGZ24_03820 [Fuerstiella sp.]
MTIKIKCRKCEAKFSVKDAAAGRRVKCRQCAAPIKVPVPKAAEEELLNFDMAAYGNDPSGNEPSGGTQPLPRRRKKKTTGSESNPGRKWDFEDPLLWFVVPVAAAVLVFLATMIHLRIGGIIAMLIVAVAGFVVFVAYWRIVLHAFGESGLSGLLCLFLPFYIVYWVLTEWHATRKSFLAWAFATWTITATTVSFYVAFGIWFTEAISTLNEIQERQIQERQIQEREVQAEADPAP